MTLTWAPLGAMVSGAGLVASGSASGGSVPDASADQGSWWPLLVLALAAVAVVVVVRVVERLRVSRPRLWWIWWGAPVALWRLARTWRVLCEGCDLVLPARRASRYGLVGSRRGGGVIVKGSPVRVILARRVGLRVNASGFTVRVRLFASQTPGQFAKAAEAMAHAWRVHAVRVTSPRPGTVELTALGYDPLRLPSSTAGAGGRVRAPRRAVTAVVEDSVPGPGALAASIGVREDGAVWVVDLAARPHHLVTGATQSGKSTLTAALLVALAPRPVALVGVDAKGGIELGLFEPRLSALATTRAEAAAVLEALTDEVLDRMGTCRTYGVRSAWDLPEQVRPVPVVVLVDEVAEVFLYSDRAGKDEASRCVTALVRLAQLGAALGVHLWISGQRFGSELGSGATLLRAQLAGRICHRVADVETAEMTLAGLPAEATAAALSIPVNLPGVAVVGDDSGTWMRARGSYVPLTDAVEAAHAYAGERVELPGVTAALARAREQRGGDAGWR